MTASKVRHTVKHAANRTARLVAAAARSDGFAFDAVLLRGEGEGDMVDGSEERKRINCCVEDVAPAAEGDVAEMKRGGVLV